MKIVWSTTPGFGDDKIMHLVVGAIIGGVACSIATPAIAMASALIAAVCKEVMDIKRAGTAEVADVVATLAGCAAACAIFWLSK
jgi:hypothetical protein